MTLRQTANPTSDNLNSFTFAQPHGGTTLVGAARLCRSILFEEKEETKPLGPGYGGTQMTS